jgi:hypothetical protein
MVVCFFASLKNEIGQLKIDLLIFADDY